MIIQAYLTNFNPEDMRYADVRAQVILYQSPSAGLVVDDTVEVILF